MTYYFYFILTNVKNTFIKPVLISKLQIFRDEFPVMAKRCYKV